MLRTTSEPEKVGSERKQQNEELHDFHFSQNSIRMVSSRRTKRAGKLACMVEKKEAYRISVGKPDGKKPLGRSRRRW